MSALNPQLSRNHYFDYLIQNRPELLSQGLGQVPDYDMNSFLKYNIQSPQAGQGGLHLTDMFKLPQHQTFSNESAYSNSQAGNWGPLMQLGSRNYQLYHPSSLGVLNGKRSAFESW